MSSKRLLLAGVTCAALLLPALASAQNYYGGLFHDGIPLRASDLNANNTAIYASINALAGGSFLPLTGGTLTGPLVLTTPLAPSSGGTGADNGSTIIVAGPFATVGAYNLTLTTTANTSVTLPTSGTLAQNTLANVTPVVGRTALGVPKVVTLESIAQANGLTLGTSNDQAIFDLANAAIVAAATTGGLTVTLPLNTAATPENATSLILDNDGGYTCPVLGKCFLKDIYSGPYTSATNFIQINPSDPYATNITLDGIYVDGGWSYTNESDPALGKRTAVSLVNEDNGVNDGNYVTNSYIASQEPRNYIENMVIGRFAGDGMDITGAGANITHNVRFQRIGAYGMNINGYDSQYSDIDDGEVGLSGIYCHDNCAASRFSNVKIWYADYRTAATASAGLDQEGASGNQFTNIEIQDDGAGCFRADNVDLTRVTGACQLQGQINHLVPTFCAITMLGSIDSLYDITVSLLDHAGQTYYAANKLICDGRSLRDTGNTTYAYHNTVRIMTEGFPQDFNGFSQSWINGPYDTSNQLSVNNALRTPSNWIADPATGQVNVGANMCGTIAGMVAFGPLSPYAGGISIITPGCNGVTTAALSGENTTGTYASAALTSTANYANNETVQVGANVYTFKTTLTGAPYEVHLGSTEAQSIQNLTYAINAANAAVVVASTSGTTLNVPQVLVGSLHVGDTVTCADPINCGSWVTTTIASLGSGTGGLGTYNLANSEPTIAYTNMVNVVSGVIGTDYGYGTTPSFQVFATVTSAHALAVKAQALGTGGNSIPVATTAAHASWPSGDLSGGTADNQSYPQAASWNSLGQLSLPGFPLSTGVQPTYTGTCSTGSQVGSTAVGGFKPTIVCNGTTTGSVILTFAYTAPNGYSCTGTGASGDLIAETAYTTTSVTFTVTGASGDQFTYQCRAF